MHTCRDTMHAHAHTRTHTHTPTHAHTHTCMFLFSPAVWLPLCLRLSPCLRVSVSPYVSPCLRVSVSPCLRVSVSPCLRVSLSLSPLSRSLCLYIFLSLFLAIAIFSVSVDSPSVYLCMWQSDMKCCNVATAMRPLHDSQGPNQIHELLAS